MASHESRSTDGSPWRIEVDGVVQEGLHDDLHKAVSRGYSILVEQPNAEVAIRREAEIRLTLDLPTSDPAPEPEPEPEPEAVADLIVSPDMLDLEVGETADLDAQVVGTSGNPLDQPVAWSSDDPSIATVDADGLVTAVAEGATVVWAESGTVRDPTDVNVVAVGTAPEPSPDPDPSGALVVDDPDSFSCSAEVRANGYDRTSIIHLDTQVARPGGSKSIRYDYVDQGPDNAIHAGRRLDLPARLKELWLETQCRWSANFFAIQNPPTTPGWTFAHKFLFLEVKSQQPESWLASDGTKMFRWAVMWPGGGSSNPPHATIKYESPGLDPDATQPAGMNVSGGVAHLHVADAAQFFDEQWHQLRMHIRHDPGLMEITVDGQSIGRLEGMVIHPEADIVSVLLGRNKDDGIESGTESLWWGKTKAHDTDPGWGI